jgi:anthranilate synthase
MTRLFGNELESSLGRPYNRPNSGEYISSGGVQIKYEVNQVINADDEVDNIVTLLDDHKGVLLTSSYEFPGRYARWTVGFTSPPIQIEGKGYEFKITALNERGVVLSDMIKLYLKK